MTFTPDPNKSGITFVNVSVSDDGGREHGGLDSRTKLFAIAVTPVNDPPSIQLAGDVNLAHGSGSQSISNSRPDLTPGTGDDDSLQVISDFIVSVERPEMFAVLPDISNEGTLTFTPLSTATGTTTVTVQVRDNGGRGNGGDDLSDAQTFQIGFGTSPAVESLWINSGAETSRSIVTSLTVVFDQTIEHAGLAGAFTVRNIDSGVDVETVTVAASDSDGKTTVVLTFGGRSTEQRSGGRSLADGNYLLEINASLVKASGGDLTMDSNYRFGGQTSDQPNNDNFFRLFGDTDGDGDVDGQDYGRFGLTFLKQALDPAHNTEFDHDGDGDVDGQDYGQFGLRFLKRRS